MREIKFRAWDKSLKKFYYPELWDSSMPSNWKEWYILNQFTGLKDKNGQEIYEDDIFKFINHRTEIQLPIKFHPLHGWRPYLEGYGGFEWTPLAGEVIGNIYENPELL